MARLRRAIKINKAICDLIVDLKNWQKIDFYTGYLAIVYIQLPLSDKIKNAKKFYRL